MLFDHRVLSCLVHQVEQCQLEQWWYMSKWVLTKVIMNGCNHNCNMNGDRILFKNAFMGNNIKLEVPQVRILDGYFAFFLIIMLWSIILQTSLTLKHIWNIMMNDLKISSSLSFVPYLKLYVAKLNPSLAL